MRYVLSVGFLLAISLPLIPQQHAPPPKVIITSERRWSDVAAYYEEQRLNDTIAQLNTVTADRDAKANENTELKQKNAALEAASKGVGGTAVSTPLPSTSVSYDHFPYGYCTWYVASKREIPWNGNAIEWFVSAQAYGYTVSSQPRIHAIMVTYENPPFGPFFGHVAYVESLNPLIVSEMNYRGWGVVDFRLVTSSVPIRGFIW